MSVTFPCIPDIADVVPPLFAPLAQAIKCCPPTGDQIYSVLYAIGQSIDLVTTGIVPPAQQELEDAFIRYSVIMTVPWALMLVALFILLIASRTITPITGIFFIIITLVVAVLAVLWVVYDVQNTSDAVYDKVIGEVRARFNTYESDIISNVIGAYLLTESCNKDEPNSCCTLAYGSCVSGCGNQLSVDPPAIPVSSTGTITVSITTSSAATGTITIPGELLGTPAPMVIGFTGSDFSQDVTYATNATPGSYDVVAVFYDAPSMSYFTSTFPVIVYEPVPTTLSIANEPIIAPLPTQYVAPTITVPAVPTVTFSTVPTSKVPNSLGLLSSLRKTRREARVIPPPPPPPPVVENKVVLPVPPQVPRRNCRTCRK